MRALVLKVLRMGSKNNQTYPANQATARAVKLATGTGGAREGWNRDTYTATSAQAARVSGRGAGRLAVAGPWRRYATDEGDALQSMIKRDSALSLRRDFVNGGEGMLARSGWRWWSAENECRARSVNFDGQCAAATHAGVPLTSRQSCGSLGFGGLDGGHEMAVTTTKL